jgi:hypothetical protein
MAKARVTLQDMKRIAEGDWQIIAEYPGAEDRLIKGLTRRRPTPTNWLSGSRRRSTWLRSQGYAK